MYLVPLYKVRRIIRYKMSSSPLPQKTSTLLLKLIQDIDKKAISLNDISPYLGKRGLALCNLLLALPSSVPIGLPVISSFTGAIIMIVALQMVFCSSKLYLPAFIGNYQFSTRLFRKIILYSIPILRHIEKLTKPRWELFIRVSESLSGLVIAILGFILFLPLPFFNFISAFCICVLSIGFLERDGFIIFLSLSIIISCLIMKYHIILMGLRWIYSS
jgi:hypothetical protein